MEHDYFLSKISCEFAVITRDVDCHVVTKELNIEPDWCYNKGDEVSSNHSSGVIFRPHGLWAVESGEVVSNELDISRHIRYFRDLLGSKIDVIEKLKNQYKFECVFTINIETEGAGEAFGLSESELSFIKTISTRCSCSFLCEK